jgi:anaerobic selenocysteine-containing dehydrogenase
MQILKTTCPLDCWDACGMIAHVQDGKLVKLGGDPDHPVTRGFLCGKTMRYGERAYAPDRILFPQLKNSRGEFERISWEQALDLLEKKFKSALKDHGPHSILHIQEGGNMGVMKKLSKRFFSLLGGHTEFVGDICFGAGEAAMVACMGEQASHLPEDLRNSKLIILWGRNPFITHIHWVPFLKDAKAAGAQIISINPLRIDKSGLCDLQLQPRPGSDLFLAAFLAKFILDEKREDRAWLGSHSSGLKSFRSQLEKVTLEKTAAATGLESVVILQLARDYLEASPASIYFGAGLQHHVNGVETTMALCALGALAGNLGKAGGGVSFYIKHRKAFDLDYFTPNPVANRHVPLAQFGALVPKLRDPAPQIIWVNAANPVRTLSDAGAVAKAFAAIPFKVVVDFIPNDTTALADLLLPGTSFLEEGGVVSSYGQGYLGKMQPVIDRVGEAKSDGEIFHALAVRLGFGDQMPADEAAGLERVAKAGLNGGWVELQENNFTRNPAVPEVPFAGGKFPTEDGKFHFPEDLGLDKPWPAPSEKFPLQLLSPKNPRMINSQGSREVQERPAEIALHPQTAASLNLHSGDPVWVESEQGKIPAIIAADDAVHPQAARCFAAGSTLAKNGINLLSGTLTDASGMCPAYYTVFVKIDKRD